MDRDLLLSPDPMGDPMDAPATPAGGDGPAAHLTVEAPNGSISVSTGPAHSVAMHGGAGWHPDPREPGRRLRWWDGTAWTVRVVALEADSEGISWHASMADLAPPVAHATVPGIATTVPGEIKWAPPVEEPDPVVVPLRRRHRRRWALALAAALVVALTAGAGAAILPVGNQTPTVEPTLAYRDTAAGFSLRYPEQWRQAESTSGEGIRFDVGASAAPASKANTVTVAVDTAPSPFPALHELANEVTSRLREDFPDMRLESAEEIQLLHAPAYTLRLSESSGHAISVEQTVGQTTDGRLVKVTVTVREPRSAPTERELHDFLASMAGTDAD